MGPSENQTTATAPAGELPGGVALSADAELILDAIGAGVLAIDADGRTTLANETACRALGLNAIDLIGRTLHDLIHHSRPDGSVYPAEECPLHATLRDGLVRHNESDVFWRPDGTAVPVEYDSRPIRRNGTIAGVLVSFRDISERQRNEERTRQLVREQFARAKAEFQHTQLRDALAQTPALVCVTRGPRHVIEVVNDRYDRATDGRARPGLAFAEAFSGIEAERLALMDRAFDTGEAQAGREIAGSDADGGQRVFDFVIQPLRDETGAVYGLMTHAVDVTDQVRARRDLELRTAELEKTSERLRLAAEAGRMGAWEWHIGRNEVIWSPELQRIHGLEPGTFDGTFDAYQRDIHPDDRDRVLKSITDTLEQRTPHRLEYRIVLPDGRVRWLEARGRLFLDAGGEPERLVGICMDVTERKRQEDDLRQSEEAMRQRAEELAQLALALERSNRELDAFAYAASHDLRAPLRGIANLAQWIEEDLQDRIGDETREMLALMRTRMHRMEGLIEGLLQYSRAGRVHQAPERVDTRRLVRDVVDLLAPGEGVEVEIAAGLPTLTTEKLPLQQVLLNLIGNALKHARRGDARVAVSARRTGAFWEFAVADNGPGIEPQYHERIWGIFQTLDARDRVEGTGIGLALVKKLVDAQGGRAWVESAPGAGATFKFLWRAA